MKRTMLLLSIAVLFVCGTAFAQSDSLVISAMSETIHQDTLDIANDLHFRAYIMEPWVKILDWDVKAGPFQTIVGTLSDDSMSVWFDCTDGIVPYCEWITIDVTLYLNSWNAVHIDSIIWTYEDEGSGTYDTVPSDVPGNGFAVDYIDAMGLSTYWFYNDDTEPVIVKNFRYAINQPKANIGDLSSFTEWTTFLDPFTVEPGKSFAVPIEGMVSGKFLYIGLDLYSTGASALCSEELYATEYQMHQDQSIPGVSKIGIEEQGLLKDVKFIEVNSFSDYTEIRYSLPKATHANVSVYSVSGERVATLVDGVERAGAHTIHWDGTDSRGSRVAAGLYICRLSADGIQASEKMVRVK